MLSNAAKTRHNFPFSMQCQHTLSINRLQCSEMYVCMYVCMYVYIYVYRVTAHFNQKEYT
jgi:hypothetical protein